MTDDRDRGDDRRPPDRRRHADDLFTPYDDGGPDPGRSPEAPWYGEAREPGDGEAGGPSQPDPGRVAPGRAERRGDPVYPGRANRNAPGGRITGRLTRPKPAREARDAPPPGDKDPPGRDPAGTPWSGSGQERLADQPPPAGRPHPEDQPRPADSAIMPGRAARYAPPPARAGSGGAARASRQGRPRPRLPAGSFKVTRAGLALAGVLVAAAGALVGITRVLPAAKAPAAPAAEAPYAGRWVCPTLPRLPGAVTVTNVGAAPATLRTQVTPAPRPAAGAGRPQRAAGAGAGTLAPGATRKITVNPSTAAGFVQVEAFGAPIAVASAQQPSCAPGPGDRWWLPGLTASSTTRSDLVLANPDSVDATVAITPHLTEGSIHPTPLQNIFIPAGTSVVKTIDVPDVQTLPFTAEVVATSGRVVTGALVTTKTGRQTTQVLVPGQPTARSSWAFTGGLGQGVDSVDVLLANPNQGPLTVVAHATTDQGTFKAPGFDLPIADGAASVIRVPLNPGRTGAFSLLLESRDGVKFVAALRLQGGGSTASFFETGGTSDDARWLLPEAPGSGRLVLANVSDEPVTAELSSLGSPGRTGSSVTVPPGKVRLQAVPAGSRSVLVTASRPGMVAAPLGGGQVVPGSQVGGLPVDGPVVPGPAAAP